MPKEKNNIPDLNAAFEKHSEEQIIFIANNTTPQQRLEWLEEMIILLDKKKNKTKAD